MIRHRVLLVVLAAALACAPAAGAGREKRASDNGPRDRWLAEALMAELGRASGPEDHKALAAKTSKVMLARLACGDAGQLETLSELAYVLRACKYLPLAAKTAGGDEFAQWLAANRPLARRMFRALADVKGPAEALAKLQQLQAAERAKVLSYPDLAVAFATSRPMKHYRPPHGPATMLESFRYFTSSRRFRFDLKQMPYELARYLATSRLGLGDRRWAAGRYAGRAKPAKSYFDVRHDADHFYRGRPKKIAKLAYTMPNLRRAGGVCVDQAYYASEVCRSLGIPAAIVSGEGASGMGHAWVACLMPAGRGKPAAWDAQTARYRAHQYYSGDVIDPATGRRMPDAELSLAGAAAQLPLESREQADAAVLLARKVDQAARKRIKPDLSVLKELAQEYNRGRGGEERPRADTGWIRSVRRLDINLVEDLIFESVHRNLACRPAWELIVELRQADRLPVEHLNRFFDVLVTRTSKSFPEYSCLLVLRIVPTIKDPVTRETVYKRSLGKYGWRPDLQGQILIALADDYRSRGLGDKALETYADAATRSIKVPDAVITATRRAEEILLKGNRPDMAIGMYRKLFAMTRPEDAATAFRKQTSYYRLGSRLADLLEAQGKADEARRIRVSL